MKHIVHILQTPSQATGMIHADNSLSYTSLKTRESEKEIQVHLSCSLLQWVYFEGISVDERHLTNLGLPMMLPHSMNKTKRKGI